jgi:ATP-dependent helicase/nuclease subunit A
LPVPVSDEKINLENNLQLNRFAAGNWTQKIVIKQSGKQFYNPDLKAKIDKIQYGIKVHEVLSRIKLSSDVAAAMQDVIAEGIISLDESHEVRKQIQQLLDHPKTSNWFSDSWQVHNEASILLPEAKELRIDRLLIRDKQAIVIDYKTGDKKSEDKAQVSAYMLALKNMSYAVKGYLLYLSEAEIDVEEVKYGIAANESQDQLSLNL